METIAEKLNHSRQELLDLSLKNNGLLNYKLLKSRGVSIEDEIPQEIYRILVVEGKAMTFLPKLVDENDVEDEFEVWEESEELADRHLDNKLQTKYFQNELHKRLLNSYYLARTYIEEQGVNVLYLALGMLEWYESETSDILRQAPLVLVPVELKRTSVKAPFRLRYTEDDFGENLSLSAKLNSDFGIELPPLEISDDIDIRTYFQAVSDAIRNED